MADHTAPTIRRPVLLCFDGSDNAADAIAEAGTLFFGRPALVLMAWEPVGNLEVYDPATIVTTPLTDVASRVLDLEEIEAEVAQDVAQRGVKLAAAAGFIVEGRAVKGRASHVICDVAQEIDAAAIVMGARGHLRLGSLRLGSVSSVVLADAHRPVLIVPASRD